MRHAVTRLILALAVFATALSAHATFHLWEMTEIYSNADGSVQYVEFSTSFGGQEFLRGHTLSSFGGGATRSYTFQTDLPGDSGGRRFLVGTQGFAALGVVTPDYTVPDGFLFPAGGTLDFAGADSWTYPALPSDGVRSLDRSGSTGTNSPTNFARATGTLAPAPAEFNVQGLWWRSPAESESGWGMNISHQGTILFVTWFTYGADGSGMWLVMPAALRTGANAYAGSILRTTGPAFDAATFDPARVVATTVGAGTLTFSDAGNGTFAYTVDNVTQSKSITRQIYAARQSACSQSGTAAGTTSFQDLWWNSPPQSESGWGVNLAHQGDILFGTWFTYGTDGKGVWFVMPALRRTTGNTFSGDVLRTTGPAFNSTPFDPRLVAATTAGTATFTFGSPDSGTFTYFVNGVTRTKTIERQVYSTPTSTCAIPPPPPAAGP